MVIGSDLAPSDNLPAAIYAEDGKFDPASLQDTKSDTVKLFFNGGNKTDLEMSFLQKYFKSVSDFESSEWATYSSDQYLKTKYELLIRGFKYRDFDYERGLAFSTVKGEKIKYVFDVPNDGNYIIAKRSADKQNQKLSWSIKVKNLKKGNFEYVLENLSGFDVLNTVALIPEENFTGAQKLADAYVSIFGTITSSGLADNAWQAVILQKVDTLKYRLDPAQGSNWLVFTQNYDPRWQVVGSEGVTLHLPIYSMINGFYLGTDNSVVTLEFSGQNIFRQSALITGGTIIVLLAVFGALKFLMYVRKN